MAIGDCQLPMIEKVCLPKTKRPATVPVVFAKSPKVYFVLEVQLHAKLKLAWVIRGGRETVVPAITRALIERIDVAKQR